MRRPVKLPGPAAHANSSTSSSDRPASSRLSLISLKRLFEWETWGSPFRAASSSLPRPKKTLPPSVAVSKLRIIGRPGISNLVLGAFYRRATDSRINVTLVDSIAKRNVGLAIRLKLGRQMHQIVRSYANEIHKLIGPPGEVVELALQVKGRRNWIGPALDYSFENMSSLS